MMRLGDEKGDRARRVALVVDDDPVLRLAVKQFVERLGFDTCDAENGRQAVDLFSERNPDIVLMDAAMPEMDGFAACAAIRQLPQGIHVPVIMITVYEDEASVDRAFQVGADEYITKPIHWAVLRNRTLHLVGSYHAERRLRDDHAFFQCLVDSIPEPTVVVDRDRTVRWMNASIPGFFLFDEARVGAPLTLRQDVFFVDQDLQAGGQRQQPMERIVKALLMEDAVECVLCCESKTDGRLFAQLNARLLRGVDSDARGYILRLQNVTEREREREALRLEASTQGDLARRDALTGLANRRLFEECLRERIGGRGAPQLGRLALLFLDLDGFKAINDTYGHAAGDRVLCAIGARLEGLVRSGDLVARLGGDEFGVLLADIDANSSVAVLAHRLLDSIRQPVMIDDAPCTVSASIGVSIYPDDAYGCEGLVAVADAAMYRVKGAGKCGIEFAEPHLKVG